MSANLGLPASHLREAKLPLICFSNSNIDFPPTFIVDCLFHTDTTINALQDHALAFYQLDITVLEDEGLLEDDLGRCGISSEARLNASPRPEAKEVSQ